MRQTSRDGIYSDEEFGDESKSSAIRTPRANQERDRRISLDEVVNVYMLDSSRQPKSVDICHCVAHYPTRYGCDSLNKAGVTLNRS